MMIYVKIQNKLFPAIITGRIHDKDWDDRASKSIKVELSYEEAQALFVDDVTWSVVQETEEIIEEIAEDGEVNFSNHTITEEYDNSEYNVAGDITDHRNGYVTIKMGKMTADELLAMFEEVL